MMTVLMLTAVSVWAVFAWKEIVDRSHQRQRVRFEIAANNLIAIDQQCPLKDEVIRKVIGNAMQNSSFSYFVLERNGKAEISMGNVPDFLYPKTSEGELFQGHFICFWKMLKAEPDGNRIMIVGGNIKNDRGYKTQTGNLIVTVILADLLIFANLAAWIMMTRSRKLAEQLDAQRARSAYLEDLELAAAGLAHETKNPLGIISGMAQQIAHDPSVPKDILNKVEGIIDEVDKASSRLGHFLVYARNRDVSASPVDIRKTIDHISAILKVEFESAGVMLDVDCPDFAVIADEDMLRQILVNLLLNSLRASAQGTQIGRAHV
jgi:signal transduction histidine kinase